MEDFNRQVEGKMLEPLILQFFLAMRACLSFEESVLRSVPADGHEHVAKCPRHGIARTTKIKPQEYQEQR